MDLDDEELKATRKLNGSDKDVGNMEEDLKDIELFIDFCRAPYNFEHGSDAKSYKELSNKIEHLIKAYKKLEKENKIIKGNYITLCADIQMVTTELGFPEDTIIADEIIPMIKENYIPVSLVEETIEELNKLLEEDLQDERKINSNRFIIICQCKSCLQKLLERRK